MCLIALSICSCSPVDSDKDKMSKVESVLRIKNQDEQRVAYNLLSQTEKFNLWDAKFERILESYSLDEQQKLLISDLRKNLSTSIFTDLEDDRKEYFKNIYVPNYLKKVEKEFTKDQAELIFYSLSSGGEPEEDGGILEKDNCNCNQGSLFGCGSSQSCKNKFCKGTTTGCGFLWAWECNGMCRLF